MLDELCLYRTIKDAKRRVVESVLEGVGKSEKTVDEEFDLFVSKYQTMLTDMNECKIYCSYDFLPLHMGLKPFFLQVVLAFTLFLLNRKNFSATTVKYRTLLHASTRRTMIQNTGQVLLTV